jgi:ornithine carbamoyltransferase
VALARALCRFQGVHLELRTPPGHGLPPEVSDMAVARGAARGAVVVERHDMRDLPADTDVIYTTRWQTTGTVKSDADWRDVFAPFQVDASLWQDSPKAVLMHDLPAHRGDEITGEILDGPNSIAFTQAGFKLWSAMAVLEWCCGRGQVAQAGTE